MKVRPTLMSLALAGSLLSAPATANDLDLSRAFELASEHDPQIAAAREQLRADREQIPQARAQFLPQIAVQGDVTRIEQDTEYGDTEPGLEPFTAGGSTGYTTSTVGVNLTQSLFRRESFIALQTAQLAVDLADLQHALARQQLALRVSQAYFRVLQAEDAVTSFDAETRAIESQLQRARRSLQLGAGTVTDVNDAQARFDSTRAQRLAAVNELRVARENLRRLVGAPIDSLAGLPARFEPEAPQPADPQAWARLAEERNLQVLLAQSNLELAARDIERSRAARFPQVDLVANYGRNYQGYQPTVRTDVETDQLSVGVNVSVPLYTGGAISANVRRANALREVNYHRMRDARREAALNAESAYLNLASGLEQVRALEQALSSIQSTERSTQRGLELGLRTTLDLLNIQRERFQIERELAAARYGYLQTYLQLQAAVGEALDERAIDAVNTYLRGREA